LLKRCTFNRVPRVRIPPSPLYLSASRSKSATYTGAVISFPNVTIVSASERKRAKIFKFRL
ncbi:MAG: hypothetical protein WB586_19105, partial [Chthoniobacterales bacterium]